MMMSNGRIILAILLFIVLLSCSSVNNKNEDGGIGGTGNTIDCDKKKDKINCDE